MNPFLTEKMQILTENMEIILENFCTFLWDLYLFTFHFNLKFYLLFISLSLFSSVKSNTP